MDAPAPIVAAIPEEAAPPRRGVQMPAWLAVLIVLIVAGGFGYLGWRMLKPPPAVDLSQYDSNDVGRRHWRGPNAPGFAINRPAQPAAPPEGVTLEANGNGMAYVPTLSLRISVSTPKPTITAMTTGNGGVSAEDRVAVRARMNALGTADVRKAANVTDDQFKKLQAIQPQNPPPLTADGRAKMLDLWAKYRAADAAAKPAAQKAVLDEVRQLAAAHTAARAAAAHATAEAIRKVLSNDQVARLTAR